MRQRSGWQKRGEEILDKQQADARSVGHAYLQQFALWYKSDPCKPRLKTPAMNHIAKSGFPDPPRLPRDEETAEAVGGMVLRMPPELAEVVWGVYLQIRWRRASNTDWVEHLRYWKVEDCANRLKLSRRTFYRRLAMARDFVEREAEALDLPPPMMC